LDANCRSWLRKLRLGWRIPIVDDLAGENEVESEAGDISVKDEGIVDFLERGENATEGSKEEVKDLKEFN
jgi:hypothetical protein